MQLLSQIDLHCRDGNGKTHYIAEIGERYVELTPSAYGLLSALQAGATFETIAARINAARMVSANEGADRPITSQQVAQATQNILSEIEKQQAEQTNAGYWFRLHLLPAHWVVRTARRLHWLYQPWGAAIVAIGFLLITGLALGNAWFPDHLHLSYTGLALMAVSLFWHELGHATACSALGGKPRDIGVIIYLVFPSVYSDVSDAWRLKRWQRVVVDLGGIYFHLMIAGVYLLGYGLTGWNPLREAFLLIITLCLLSLNPVLKFDGYWMLSDLLDVPNLSQQPKQLWQHALKRWRGQPTAPLPWGKRTIAFLSVYSVVSVGVLVWLTVEFLPILARSIWQYPSEVADFWSTWQVDALTTPEIFLFVGTTISVAIGIVIFSRIIKQGLQWRHSRT